MVTRYLAYLVEEVRSIEGRLKDQAAGEVEDVLYVRDDLGRGGGREAQQRHPGEGASQDTEELVVWGRG